MAIDSHLWSANRRNGWGSKPATHSACTVKYLCPISHCPMKIFPHVIYFLLVFCSIFSLSPAVEFLHFTSIREIPHIFVYIIHFRHCTRASTTFTIANRVRPRVNFAPDFVFSVSSDRQESYIKKHMFTPLHQKLTNILTLLARFIEYRRRWCVRFFFLLALRRQRRRNIRFDRTE